MPHLFNMHLPFPMLPGLRVRISIDYNESRTALPLLGEGDCGSALSARAGSLMAFQRRSFPDQRPHLPAFIALVLLESIEGLTQNGTSSSSISILAFRPGLSAAIAFARLP